MRPLGYKYQEFIPGLGPAFWRVPSWIVFRPVAVDNLPIRFQNMAAVTEKEKGVTKNSQPLEKIGSGAWI